MTEKRFVNKGKDIFQYGEWWCSANGEHCADVIATAINELIEENEKLKKILGFLQNDNANDILNVLNSQENQIWELKKENKQLKSYTGEMEDYLARLEEKNEQLKAQLYCDYNEGVCSICKHHYLEKTNMFYISKCEKGHEKCSKESVRHCEDFKLKELQE